jgi:outer membrane protein TolC
MISNKQTYLRLHILLLMLLLTTIGAKAQTPDSLATYIAAAIRNNPTVISGYNAYKAQVMNACGAGSLNDPTIQVGVFPKSMQHVNGKQIATFTIMQMFPWFGTLKAGRENMEYKAESAYQKFRADGIALAYDVQKQWYAMLATQEKIKAVKGKIGLLEDIKKLALLTYKTQDRMRNAKMSDQLRLEAEEQNLQEQVESFEAKLALQRQQFNIVMHRDADAPLVVPDTIVLREMPTVSWNDIEAQDPLLQKSVADGKAFEAQKRLATNMGKPTFSVGLQYMLNGKVMNPKMESMNGMDMVMPMVTVSVPIYRRKINMSKEAAKFNKISTDYTYQSREDALKSEYLGIEQRAEDVKRKVALYDKEVGILDHTLSLMNTEYATGSTTLTDILETNRQYIDYALKKAEAYADYNTIVAEYEKMASRYDYATRAENPRK